MRMFLPFFILKYLNYNFCAKIWQEAKRYFMSGMDDLVLTRSGETMSCHVVFIVGIGKCLVPKRLRDKNVIRIAQKI